MPESNLLSVLEKTLLGRAFIDSNSGDHLGETYTIDKISITPRGQRIALLVTYEGGARFPILLEQHYQDLAEQEIPNSPRLVIRSSFDSEVEPVRVYRFPTTLAEQAEMGVVPKISKGQSDVSSLLTRPSKDQKLKDPLKPA